MKGKQIICFGYFGSGMALKCHAGVGFRHSFPVVDDLHQCLPRVLDQDLDLCGTGINSILDQLFDNRSWSLNHFARRNLIGDAVRQQMYDIAHLR